LSKSARQKEKEKSFRWMAKFVKLRDAIEDKIDPDFRYVRCRSCGMILERGTRGCQAGHFIGRGLRGQSGVYFNEYNVWTQGSTCNRFEQGNRSGFDMFFIKRFGKEKAQQIIEDLKIQHKTNSYTLQQIIGLGLYYKQKYEELCREYGIT